MRPPRPDPVRFHASSSPRHREARESGAAARRRPCFNRRRSSATLRIKTGPATQVRQRSQMCRYCKPTPRGRNVSDGSGTSWKRFPTPSRTFCRSLRSKVHQLGRLFFFNSLFGKDTAQLYGFLLPRPRKVPCALLAPDTVRLMRFFSPDHVKSHAPFSSPTT